MRHNIINAVAFLALATFLAVSCDKIDEPYLAAKNGSGTVVTATSKVLLEDFTGQKCTNCPRGHLEAHNIQALYPDQIILVGIHSGFYAIPDASGNYTADYRTDAGEEITNQFSVESYPSGLINRSKYNQKYTQGVDAWQECVANELEKTAQAAITLQVEWNSASRNVSIKPAVNFIEDVAGQYNLCVIITEDSLNSPQANKDSQVGPTPVIDPYYHRHVLRGAVNGTWGESLNTENDIAAGTNFSKSYTFALPQTWDETHCSVVAYVSRMDDSDAKYSVIQVEEAHVVHSK